MIVRILQYSEKVRLLLLSTRQNVVADQIRGLRDQKGWTQHEAAEECKIPFPTYRDAENRNAPRLPGTETLIKIAKGYGVNIAVVLGDVKPTIIEHEHGIEECVRRVSYAALNGGQAQPARVKVKDLAELLDALRDADADTQRKVLELLKPLAPMLIKHNKKIG